MNSIKLMIASQMVSLLGSGLTRFGIAIWCFEKGLGSTVFSLIGVSALLPGILAAPFSGVIVDRSRKKKILILSEIGSALGSALLLGLVYTDSTNFALIALATALGSIADSFQWPALSTSVTLLVPQSKLGKVNGIIASARSLSVFVAPAIAGALIGWIQFEGLLLLDFISFGTAIAMLLKVSIPDKEVLEKNKERTTCFRDELLEGARFIQSSPKLKTLLLIFICLNIVYAAASTLRRPFSLSFLTSSQFSLTEALLGLGMFLGGLLMARWGGPQIKIRGVVLSSLGEGLLLLPMALFPSFFTFSLYALASGILSPIINGSSQSIWQSEVPVELQGRVFSLRRMIAWIMTPISTGLIGPIADFIVKPQLGSHLDSHWPVSTSSENSLLIALLGSAMIASMTYFAFKTCFKRSQPHVKIQPRHIMSTR